MDDRPWQVMRHVSGQHRCLCVSRHATYAEAREERIRRNTILLAQDRQYGRRPSFDTYYTVNQIKGWMPDGCDLKDLIGHVDQP